MLVPSLAQLYFGFVVKLQHYGTSTFAEPPVIRILVII